MATLRLTHVPEAAGQIVELALDGLGKRRTATARFAFDMTIQDREDLRWYLEDYLQYPLDPAPLIARRVEQLLTSIGTQLFNQVFGSQDALRLWDEVAGSLEDTRVELAAGAEGATGVPWELLRCPSSGVVVALQAGTFARHQVTVAASAVSTAAAARPGALRVLLVICRPGGSADVPFRSVASALVRLSRQAREAFQLDVLRPPTFAELARVLRAAQAAGSPYHVVHFDGHGAYLTGDQVAAAFGGEAVSTGPGALRPGAHGYLFFEDPDVGGNQRLVDGPALGAVLADAGVPVLVLNACRSAHADLVAEPETVTAELDAEQRIWAYGSLAQEVVEAGVAGVVAMRYNVWVHTAAQFIGQVYAGLLAGRELGSAVSAARRHLAAHPLRQVGGQPRPLQDWLVPVVYEAAPLRLPALTAAAAELPIELSQDEAWRERAGLEPILHGGPEVGFFGRDETLLALDRAYDSVPMVLLHAWAGAGKTSTALEFARWYMLTGAVTTVLFTSFTSRSSVTGYRAVDELLDKIAPRFEADLAAAGVRWEALDGAQRREQALWLLDQRPVLWVWDNVEPVAGFPAGTRSAWTAEEQQELAGFLRDLAEYTQCKVLLTSRRDEQAWLGNLPWRVRMPAMPMLERLELARAVAAQQAGGVDMFAQVQDWRPLLEFTQGNPLTITVLVRQALRDRRATSEQIEEFVAALRAGAALVTDDAAEGREASLAASLDYGFTEAFTEDERAQLALLSLFQGFVDVAGLRLMGAAEVVREYFLGSAGAVTEVPAVVGLSPDAGQGLLDRAAEIGLLTARSPGEYAVHPAVPWHLQRLFERHYGPPGSTAAMTAVRAWTQAIAVFGELYFHQFEQGDHQMLAKLAPQEANLLRARRLAIQHGWNELISYPMQGLGLLYRESGRWAEWKRLVDELESLMTDPATGGPLANHDEGWDLLSGYRIRIAEHDHDWATAWRLRESSIEWRRGQAADVLANPPETLDPVQHNKIRNLGQAIHSLGDIKREQKDPGCVQSYLEAMKLFQRIGGRREESMSAYNLGRAYEEVPGIRDLDQAERWYNRYLALMADDDITGHIALQIELGNLAQQRFEESRKAGEAPEQQARHANAAIAAYQKALELIPADEIEALGTTYNQLGIICRAAGQLAKSFDYLQKAIQCMVDCSNRYGAGAARCNAAKSLALAGRFEEALLFYRAGLRDFESLGSGAGAEVAETRQLVKTFEDALAQDKGTAR